MRLTDLTRGSTGPQPRPAPQPAPVPQPAPDEVGLRLGVEAVIAVLACIAVAALVARHDPLRHGLYRHGALDLDEWLLVAAAFAAAGTIYVARNLGLWQAVHDRRRARRKAKRTPRSVRPRCVRFEADAEKARQALHQSAPAGP